jgi:hypothetical protein
MTKREKIAKLAAMQAAKAAYNAIMKAPTKKVAGKGKETELTVKDVAKVAGNAAYKSILKAAQDMSYPAPDPRAVQGTAMSLGFKSLAAYIGGDAYAKPQAQQETAGFLQAFADYKAEQGAPPDVVASQVEAVKGILRNAGLTV